MNPVRLMFVVTEDWYFVTHRLPLARRALREGMEVLLVTNITTHQQALEREGIRVIPFDFGRGSVNPWKLSKVFVGLLRIYRRESPDLIHHVALLPVVFGGLVARVLGIRNTVHAVSGLGFLFGETRQYSFIRSIVRRVMPLAVGGGRVIVQNRYDEQMLQACGVRPEQIVRMPGVGVDLDVFTPSELPLSPPVVMFAARLLWDKGIGEFVEAARSIRQRGGAARFVVVGRPDPGNPGSLSKDVLDGWVAGGLIEWWGYRQDMAAVLRMASVVCLPTYYREGVPKVLIEAAAAGRPIVATNVPGCDEVVRHGVNGVLIEKKDAIALDHAIEGLLGNPERMNEMGARSREIAQTEFDQEMVINGTLSLYEALIRRSPGA